MTTDISSAISHAVVQGHGVRSVVADNEPSRQRRRALGDLERALPRPESLAVRGAAIRAIATTPDFHPGRPVPVGVVVDVKNGVLPHLVGNDIGCGMRLSVLKGISEDDIAGAPELDKILRHLFFQGGRNIALTGRQRRALLVEGLPGFVDSLGRGRRGLLETVDLPAMWSDLDRASDLGVFAASGLDPDFEDFVSGPDDFRHDAILGTIGGGNHFVEFGVVERVEDRAFAAAVGLARGDVALVVHSGSLDFGQRVGSRTRDLVHARPSDGRLLSETHDADATARFAMGLANAGNAACGNRLLIALTAEEAVRRAVGREVRQALVYDAAHNMAWREGEIWRHRKGACPARGAEAMAGTPYAGLGEPVMLPGSMGDGSWLLKGLGDHAGLCSAAHGAGRKLSRQEARTLASLPARLRVVGPVDFDAPEIRGRRDVRAEGEGRLREEAPGAYRPIEDVVTPMVRAGLVGRVARIRPLLTVKG